MLALLGQCNGILMFQSNESPTVQSQIKPVEYISIMKVLKKNASVWMFCECQEDDLTGSLKTKSFRLL